ncbi:MAG TPA: T9SS type A sorting domain-containing protein [Ignavibacteriaceae bacterium]
MKRDAILVLIFSAFPLLFSFTQNPEYTLYINSNGIEKSLTLGYHPFATDGIDTALGEINLPPYTPNQFDTRFRLFDTTLSTRKDFRFGCGGGGSLHVLEWKYGNNVIITGGALVNNNFYSLAIINPNNGDYLVTYTWEDSVYYNVPNEFNYLVIYSTTNVPLSWPSYHINSFNQGDLILAGSSKLLTWTLNLGFPGYTDITFSTDNGKSWSYIAQDLPHSQASFDWSVPNINSNQCIIRVGDYPCIYDEVGTFFIYQGDFPQLFPILIPVSLRNGNNEIINLTAGLHPQATSGLDTTLGETIHNFQPPGIFDAAFRYMNSYPDPDQYSRKDIQFGHHLVHGSRRYYFHVQPSPDSIVIFEASLPSNIFAEIEYHNQLPYGSIPERKYLGSGIINYQLPKSSLLSYNLFYLDIFFDNILPVELLSFEGSAIGNDVHLGWKTATETNNHGFEVQKGMSYSDFITIGFVKGTGTKISSTHYSFTDNNDVPGKYFYRLKQIDYDGSYKYSNAIEVEINYPNKFDLVQNYPNPFNPSTKISWQSPVSGWQTLKVFDVLGNEVATLIDEYKPAGKYEVEFNPVETRHGLSLPSGVYFYQLEVNDFVVSKKMLLLK